MNKFLFPITAGAMAAAVLTGTLVLASARPNADATIIASALAAPASGAPASQDHDHSTMDQNRSTMSGTQDMGDMGGMNGMAGMDMGTGATGQSHTSPPLDERESQATPAEQLAADTFTADTQATAAKYADIKNAAAGGFVPNPTQLDSVTTHYPNPANRRDDNQLDPSQPEGLVYRHNSDGTSTLTAVVYTVAAGEPAPTTGGPIFSWHAHEGCSSFLVPAGECTDTFRMLHVWVADGVVDPFAQSLSVAMGLTK